MPTIKIDLNSIERLVEYKQSAAIKSIFDYVSVEIKKGNPVFFDKKEESLTDAIVFHNDQELTVFYDHFLEEKKPFFFPAPRS